MKEQHSPAYMFAGEFEGPEGHILEQFHNAHMFSAAGDPHECEWYSHAAGCPHTHAQAAQEPQQEAAASAPDGNSLSGIASRGA